MASHRDKKYYVPLESNPQVFTNLINNVGLESLAFTDVYSLTDLDLLSFVPRPALALVLVFPTTLAYKKDKMEKEKERPDYNGKGEDEEVIWYKQTIGNACGLYGILHAISNGGARAMIKPGTPFSKLLETCVPLSPKSRAIAPEDSSELETAHKDADKKGSDTATPDRPDIDTDHHYLCFVPSHKVSADGTRKIYELDGDKKGPIFTGVTIGDDEDVLSPKVLRLVQEFFKREEDAAGGNANVNIGFSLMALVPA